MHPHMQHMAQLVHDVMKGSAVHAQTDMAHVAVSCLTHRCMSYAQTDRLKRQAAEMHVHMCKRMTRLQGSGSEDICLEDSRGQQMHT